MILDGCCLLKATISADKNFDLYAARLILDHFYFHFSDFSLD